MADPIQAGSHTNAGRYACTSCGFRFNFVATTHLPPCPSCGNGSYNRMTGDDSVNDSHPER